MGLTENQKKATEAYGTNCLVSAGAGSGKTMVLSSRVKYLIENKGLKIEQFLILTFTKLAAKEMANRIEKKLKDQFPEEAKKVKNAYITTFDSFSYSLVKKYHSYLNLNKEINIIDSNILKIKIKKILSDILAEEYNSMNDKFVEMIKYLCLKDDDIIFDIIYQIYLKRESATDVDSFDKNLKNSYSQEAFIQYKKDFEDKLDIAVTGYIENVKYGEQEVPKETKKAIDQIEGYFEQDSLVSKVQFINNIKPFSRISKNHPYKEYVDSSKEKIQDYKKQFSYSSEAELKEDFDKGKIALEEILYLLDKLTKRVDEFKKENNLYTFSDIAKLGIKMLKENNEIREEVKNQFKTIMIDEYQDTSEIQESFVNLISNNNVYQVGDIKQSIYRFRNAKPDLFRDKFDRYQNDDGGVLIKLNDNFRSRREVLTNINDLFSTIMLKDQGGCDYKKDHLINPGQTLYDDNKMVNYNYHAKIYRYESNKECDIEVEANIVADDIIDKINAEIKVCEIENGEAYMRKANLSDFCLLLDSGTKFPVIQKVFKKKKIPLFVENNTDIRDDHHIKAFISTLKIIKSIIDNDYSSSTFIHSFISLGRSYLFSLSDQQIYDSIDKKDYSLVLKPFEDVIMEKDYNSPYELILRLIDALGFYSKLTSLGDIELYQKNFDNFLNTISFFNDLDYGIDDYIDYFTNFEDNDKIEITSSKTNYVCAKMMNIHKSKGLEFPFVYILKLGTQPNTNDKINYKVENDGRIILPNMFFAKPYFASPYFALDSKEELSEQIRLLYVCMTRAHEQNILLLSNKLFDKVPSLDGKKTKLSSLVMQNLNAFVIDDKTFDPNKKFNAKNNSNDDKDSKKDNNSKEEIILDDIKSEWLQNDEEQESRPSKQLSFKSNKDYLELGNRLHFYLETIDFTSPDLSDIDIKCRHYIESFLSSSLLKPLLNNSRIYKEYSFYDSSNHLRGIIDCLIISKDQKEAYIIDYKLKNIDDEEYSRQLKIYSDYIKKQLNDYSVKCYLYSLIDKKYQEVTFDD